MRFLVTTHKGKEVVRGFTNTLSTFVYPSNAGKLVIVQVLKVNHAGDISLVAHVANASAAEHVNISCNVRHEIFINVTKIVVPIHDAAVCISIHWLMQHEESSFGFKQSVNTIGDVFADYNIKVDIKTRTSEVFAIECFNFIPVHIILATKRNNIVLLSL